MVYDLFIIIFYNKQILVHSAVVVVDVWFLAAASRGVLCIWFGCCGLVLLGLVGLLWDGASGSMYVRATPTAHGHLPAFYAFAPSHYLMAFG